MGHITNPVGFRVGRLANWSSTWASDKFTYSNNWVSDISFQRYFEYLFKKLTVLSYKKGFIFSHVDVFLQSKCYYVTVYVYNANIMLLYKGRFFYFWLRLSKLKELFLRRVQNSYLKVSLNFFKFNFLVYKRTINQDLLFKQQYNYFKAISKSKPYFYIQRLFYFLYWYKTGFLHKNMINKWMLNNYLIGKRYFFFKKNEKNKKKRRIVFKKSFDF